MSAEEIRDGLKRKDMPSTHESPEHEATPSAAPGNEEPDVPDAAGLEPPELPEEAGPPPEVQAAPASPGPSGPESREAIPSGAPKTAPKGRARRFFEERTPEIIEAPPRVLRNSTRRDVLLFGAGSLAAIAGFGYLLPGETLKRLGVRRNMDSPKRQWFLNRALRFDDDVAEALYSPNRMVPTYTRSQITPLMNNYNGATPDPGYIPGWKLTLEGLASGLIVSLDLRTLLTRFPAREQITRLVCVEGWSAIAWWSGLRFDDLLRAYPPMPQARWARVDSSVNLDSDGNPDPYFASLDLATARHPQTLLATHLNGKPLTVDYGAPLRLLAPVKLGLKCVKAMTKISYSAEEPRDYWAERGYSRYDGV